MGAAPAGVRNLFRAALVIFVVTVENATLKRIFTPILGLALLFGIYTYLTADDAQPARVTV